MIEYNLLVGLNDKDKLVQILSKQAVYKIVQDTLKDNNISAYSIIEQVGFFTNEKLETTTEKSLKINIISEKEIDFTKIIKVLKLTLNQESIGLTENKINVKWL